MKIVVHPRALRHRGIFCGIRRERESGASNRVLETASKRRSVETCSVVR